MSFTRIEPTSIDITETFAFKNVSIDSNAISNNLSVNNAITAKTINLTTGANLGPVANLKISGGTANLALVTDGTGNLRWDTPTIDSANTVRSSSQPNITSVGTLTSFAANNGTLSSNIPYTFTSNWNSVGTTFSALDVRVTDTFSGANSTLLTLSVGGNSRFSVNKSGNVTANSITLTGNVSAAYVAGTITTALQPNITSIGQLSVLGVTGNINAGNLIVSSGIYGALNGSIGAITPASGTFTNVVVNNNITASGNLSASNSNLGNAVRANFFIGDGGLLSNVSTVSSLSANYANFSNVSNIAGTVTSASQPNITSIGTLGSLTVSGQIDTVRSITTSSRERFSVVSNPSASVSRSYADGTVVYFKDIVNNFSINFTSVPTDNNVSIVLVLILSQGATPYVPSSFSLNSQVQTVKWLNGIVPTSVASKTETYSYVCLRENNTWVVTGQLNSYG